NDLLNALRDQRADPGGGEDHAERSQQLRQDVDRAHRLVQSPPFVHQRARVAAGEFQAREHRRQTAETEPDQRAAIHIHPKPAKPSPTNGPGFTSIPSRRKTRAKEKVTIGIASTGMKMRFPRRRACSACESPAVGSVSPLPRPTRPNPSSATRNSTSNPVNQC